MRVHHARRRPRARARGAACDRRAALQPGGGDAFLRRPHAACGGTTPRLGGSDHREPHGLRHPRAHGRGNHGVHRQGKALDGRGRGLRGNGQRVLRDRRRHRRAARDPRGGKRAHSLGGSGDRGAASSRCATSPSSSPSTRTAGICTAPSSRRRRAHKAKRHAASARALAETRIDAAPPRHDGRRGAASRLTSPRAS